MRKPVVAVFCMAEEGHFQRLRPLVSGLARRGMGVQVFTDPRFEGQVVAAGATLVDLFAGRSLDVADSESQPFPCRFVSFAGRYATEILPEVGALRPALVVSATFSVIGRVAATNLGVPYVNVCSGHNVDPARFVAELHSDPRVKISPSCDRAVSVLRDRFGIDDASPFSYVSGLSPFLNVYCEPEQYLTAQERRVFEPVAFFGSLPSVGELNRERPRRGHSGFAGDGVRLRAYVSFGTVVWRYYRDEALQALRSISAALTSRPDARTVISLGRTELDDDVVATLETPNVSVQRYVDQWEVLRDADVFITHHGMNSTHEAIFNLVPMISYPFFWDQPSLAAKCQELGLSVPLVDGVRAPVSEEDVRRALDAVAVRRPGLCSGLEEARRWELEVIGQRETVLDRITNFV
jgi:MGT family glycosyltransferase